MNKGRLAEAAFDEWAPYYDLTDADRQPFVAFYRSVLTPGTRSLVELGCGTGTVAIALGEELFLRHPDDARLAGVDISQRMLDIAGRREPRGEWVFGDMRAPPIEGRFDLVISCFNTLQFLLTDDQLTEALVAARRLTAPNGRLAFDIYQPNAAYLEARHSDHLARAIEEPGGRRLEIREDTKYDETAQVLTIGWRLVDAGDRTAPPVATTTYRMRQYFPAELERILDRSEWQMTHRYGDFDRSRFTEHSKRQVVVCVPRPSAGAYP